MTDLKQKVDDAIKDNGAVCCEVTALEWYKKHSNNKNSINTLALKTLKLVLEQEAVDENGLKACPFCGSGAIKSVHGNELGEEYYTFSCDSCEVSLETWDEDAWNTRNPAIEKLIKEYEG